MMVSPPHPVQQNKCFFNFPVSDLSKGDPSLSLLGFMVMVMRVVFSPYYSHISAPPRLRNLIYKGYLCTFWLFLLLP